MPRPIKAALSSATVASPQIGAFVLDDPAPDEMVIEVKAAGICHTDLSVAAWSQEPRVLGHEGAGVVVALGEAVEGFAIGDRVVATFGSCGRCELCLAGRPAYCMNGSALNFEGARSVDRPSITRPDGSKVGGSFFQQSSFATYALVTPRNCVKIPKDIDFVTAAPFGCGVQTGAGAVFNQLDVRKGDPLVVIGCGGVGLSAVMAGKILGCSPVIAVDLELERCQLAMELGATNSIAGAVDNLAERIKELTGGGAAAVLDAAATQFTFEQSILALRPGGTLGVVDLPGAFDQPVSHPGGMPFMTTKMVGIVEGDSNPQEFLPFLFDHYLNGNLPVDRLIETFPFERIGDAFDAVENQRAIKPVLTFGA